MLKYKLHNANCDGGHCCSAHGTVKVYPLGAGGNLILCRACWAHENRYRYERGKETGQPDNWPQINWETAEVYGGAPVKYRFQVCLDKGTKDERWGDVRPTGGQPYEYETRREAEDAARLCYGNDPSIVRVVEV